MDDLDLGACFDLEEIERESQDDADRRMGLVVYTILGGVISLSVVFGIVNIWRLLGK